MNIKLFLFGAFLCFFIDGPKAQEAATQLADAIRANDLPMVTERCNIQAITGIDEKSGIRPLHLACKLNRVEIVRFFLQQEQSMESGIYVTAEEVPPMVHAIRENHLEIVRLLLEEGKRTADGTWMNRSYLFHAQEAQSSQAIKDLLISKGAHPTNISKALKLSEEKSKNVSQARRWTTEIEQQVTLDKYQQIDVWNINVRASNMLEDMAEKYGVGSATYQKESVEIRDYRLKKIKRILNAHQIAQLGTLSLE